MKTKPPSREAKTTLPGVNLEMLLEYLHEQGYNGNRANRLRVATVTQFKPHAKPHPYGMATYEGHDVSFRLNHFHRISSVVPNDEHPSVYPEERIWVLVGLISPGKEFAVIWGRVEELPPSFMIPSTFKIRVIQWIDSRYRRLRNRVWRNEIAKTSLEVV